MKPLLTLHMKRKAGPRVVFCDKVELAWETCQLEEKGDGSGWCEMEKETLFCFVSVYLERNQISWQRE